MKYMYLGHFDAYKMTKIMKLYKQIKLNCKQKQIQMYLILLHTNKLYMS